jgi:hypothetical protein
VFCKIAYKTFTAVLPFSVVGTDYESIGAREKACCLFFDAQTLSFAR